MLRFFSSLFIFISLLTTVLAAKPKTTNPVRPLFIRLAHGFDFPVAPPDANGFYKSRGLRPGGHRGEDWLINGGSTHSLGLPVFDIADGKVLLARDVHVAWGNVIVVRHAYFEDKKVQFVDSLYAHLDRILVKEGDTVSRGQQIATIGNNHGMYPAHLHFELHKNLHIGVNHTGFAKTFANYWPPTDFIVKRRTLPKGPRSALLPITHFDIPIPWKHSLRHYLAHKHGSHKAPGTHHSISTTSSNTHCPHSKINDQFQVNRYTK